MTTGDREESPANREPGVAGFVLAGGRSSRMGTDKALVRLAGRPLIEHALAKLGEARIPASIAGAASELDAFAPVIDDPVPDSGPLGGVCSALRSTAARHVVLLTVDTPLLPASLICYLVHHALVTDAVCTVCSANGFVQTFPAVLDRCALPALDAELRAGRTSCIAAFAAAAGASAGRLGILPVEFVAQPGHVADPRALPPSLWFLNVNTPADLSRAESLCRA